MGGYFTLWRIVSIFVALFRSDSRNKVIPRRILHGLLLGQRSSLGDCQVKGLIGLPHQACFRPKGEQQPHNDNKPNVILPLSADFILQKWFASQQYQNKECAGKGHRQK